MLMKKAAIAAAFGLLSSSIVSAADISEEWIDKLRDIVGSSNHTPGVVDNLRETKYPGEVYLHNFNSDAIGRGKAVTKRSIKWFSSTKVLNLHHTSNAIVVEKIKSTQDELNQGILKSEFTVQTISESIKSANGKIQIGPVFDSALVCSTIKKLAQYSPEVRSAGEKIAGGFIGAGMAAVLAPAPELVHKICGLGSVAIGGIIKLGLYMFYDVIPPNVNDDGEWILSEENVKKRFPEYNKVVLKLRNVAGTKVETVWEYDKGYTSVKIINPDGKKLDEKDKELIAKMIYRTNPVGARLVFPVGYEKMSRWTINSADIGGMLLNVGIDYDSLSGQINVRNRGVGKREYDDENELKRKSVDVLTIAVDPLAATESKIIFNKKYNDKSSVSAAIKPIGHMLIVLDNNKETAAPIYVREAHFTGKLAGKLEKEKKSFLVDFKFEETSLDVKFDYVQLRSKSN